MTTLLIIAIGILIVTTIWACFLRPGFAIIGLLCLRGLWDATQARPIPGVSWWYGIYDESGPVLLPIMAVIIGILIVSTTILPILTKQSKIDLFSLIILVIMLLGIIMAGINRNDPIRAFKDVAFFSGFILVTYISKLDKQKAFRLFLVSLTIHAISDFSLLYEALGRKNFYGHDLQTFLAHTYRIYKADHFGPIVILIGFFWGWPRYVHRNKENRSKLRYLGVLFTYFALRFALNFTRLNWLVLIMTVLVYVCIRPSIRNMRRLVSIFLIIFFTIIGSFTVNGIVTGNWNLSEHILIKRLASINFSDYSFVTNDISIRFRLTESKILFQSFMKSPVVGNGFGAALSPNDPDEPNRNNISDFFNGYFGLLHKVGLIGTLLMLSSLCILYLRIARLRRLANTPLSMAMLNGALVYFIGIMLIMAVSDTLTSNFYSLIFSVTIGTAISVSRV